MAVKHNIILTSPHRKGDEVVEAQRMLNGGNRMKRDLLKGPVDGDWGPLSAQATRRAKFLIGFPPKHINEIYSPLLHAYLTPVEDGGKPLPRHMRLRRNIRMRLEKQRANRRDEIIKLAVSQIGIKESPAGSNRVKYTEWYGMVGPWCAMFMSWLGVKVGLKSFKVGSRWAYCPYIEADAAQGRHGLRLTSAGSITEDDIVLALFHFGGGEAKHVGIVEDIDIKGGMVTCIEGNTSSGDAGSQDNGGTVARRTRPLSHVRCFVLVNPGFKD